MVVGIDPSLTATGVYANGIADIVRSKPRAVEGDFIDLTIARCNDIMDAIDKIIVYARHFGGGSDGSPCIFFLEGPRFNIERTQAGHLLEMGIWYGCFYRHFSKLGNVIRLVNPSVLKKFISGKGNTRKDAIPLIVFKRWKMEFTNDPGYDKVHAFCLERLGHAVNDGTFDLATTKRRGVARRKTQSATNAKSGDRPVQVRRNRRAHANGK